MGFIKNFKRDFAQAVNEIMPEGEPEAEKKEKKKKKKKDEEYFQADAYVTQPEMPQGTFYPEQQNAYYPDQNTYPAPEADYAAQQAEVYAAQPEQETVEQPVINDEKAIKEAVSESILRGEAEEAMEKIRQRSEEESAITDEELDSYNSETAVNVEYSVEVVNGEPSTDYYAESTDQTQNVDEAAQTEPADSLVEEVTENPTEEEGQEETVTETEEASAESEKEPESEKPEDSEISNNDDQESEDIKVAEIDTEQINTTEVTDSLTADTTYITAGTIIKGDIETDGSIDIIGTVKGNVTCAGKLIVGGTIEGDVHAGEIYAGQARITGEILSDGAITVGSGTVIEGNVTASSAAIAGAVKGDIDVNGPVMIDSSAIVVGNVKTMSVQVNTGAVIKGYCSQDYAQIDLDSLFSSGDKKEDKEDKKENTSNNSNNSNKSKNSRSK